MASPRKFSVYQGDTGPLWKVGFSDNRSLSGYACKLAVAGTTISRLVTLTDANKFLVQLTPAETEQLPSGNHTVGVQLSNPSTTPPFVKELHLELVVEAQVVL